MEITFIQIFWLMVATAVTSGVLIILSALVTGYLVSRAKREQHETLLPTKRTKRTGGPIVIDEFAGETSKDSEEGLPDIIKKQNARMAADLAVMGLKEKR